jgi:hypothetical protein
MVSQSFSQRCVKGELLAWSGLNRANGAAQQLWGFGRSHRRRGLRYFSRPRHINRQQQTRS